MTLVDPDPVQTATNITTDGWHVFLSWILTPTGAILTLLLLGLGVGTGVMSLLGRSVRVLSICVKIVAALLFIWIVGGVLEAWGVPVRETITYIANQIPSLVDAFVDFLRRLFTIAG